MAKDAVFDIEAMRRVAGDKRFQRAIGYWEGDCVEILDDEDDLVIAHVTGSDDIYLVELRDPRGRDARCTCADAAELSPICKHMIAVALAVNDGGAARGRRGRFGRLRQGLEMESKEGLIALLLRLAKHHRPVLDELEGGEDA